MRALFATEPRSSLLVLRLVLGVVFFAHGAQKAFGWFGGGGWSATIDAFEAGMGIPPALASLVILAELLGGIGLVVGFLTRIAALGILAVMVGAIVKVHAAVGFFMNWSGAQGGEGYEYHLLAIAMALALLLDGAGCVSIDRRIAGRRGG